MIRVLFVCLGNICRSPMAEAVFQHMVNEAKLGDKFVIDSAGTGGWHVGETAHRGTLDVLRRNKIPYNGRARQFTRQDSGNFDYIVMMDHSNLVDAQRIVGVSQPHLTMFLHYANQAGTVEMEEVPDPYYTNRFDETFDLVTRGSQALLAHIRREEGI